MSKDSWRRQSRQAECRETDVQGQLEAPGQAGRMQERARSWEGPGTGSEESPSLGPEAEPGMED